MSSSGQDPGIYRYGLKSNFVTAKRVLDSGSESGMTGKHLTHSHDFVMIRNT
ncbi:MAG: hypothetical protein IE918_08220 [Campylobacterales bacterium]|nr:hypothetical protein [Campylobacterales bacterium]